MDQSQALELEKKIDEKLLNSNLDKEIRSLNQELSEIFNSYNQTFNDCMYVSKIYFAGFDAIDQGVIKDESGRVYAWVKDVRVRPRSGKIITNLIAVSGQ